MKKLNKPQNLNKNFEILLKYIFFSLIFTWIFFNLVTSSTIYADFFAVALSLTALFGSIFALNRSKEWGSSKSQVGLSLLFISLALLMWFFGQTFYFLDSKIENPLNVYEFFFIFIDPLYLLGIFYIAKSIGTFNYLKSNFSLILLPVLIFILNFLIVSFANRGDFLEIFYNLNITDVYIFGSIVLATFVICILLFSKKLGGIYKKALHILLIGILFQYFGDNLFAFFESQDLNGSFADLLFFVSISLVIYGVHKLDPLKLNE